LVSAAPFGTDDELNILEIGAGEGLLAEALLTRFRRAALTALDGSESMRHATSARLAPFGERARVAPFDVTALDWWDRMLGVDLIVSSLCLHHLNDAKKQYVFRAAAERLSARGALLIADIVEAQHPAERRLFAESWETVARDQAGTSATPERLDAFHRHRWNHFRFPDPADHPSPLFFQLVWLKHAGFAIADCYWAAAGHAVYGGFKSADGPASDSLSYSDAIASVGRALALSAD